MNRQQRRRHAKLSRHATDDEIFPGDHGPVQPEAARQMTAVIKVLQAAFRPNYDITLFVAERDPTAERDLPRFNYISTAEREDMYAVLRAFLTKNEAIGAKLDKINEAPPTERPQ